MTILITFNENVDKVIDDTVDDIADAVNESVWKRNIALEERLGVKIELIAAVGTGEFSNMVRNSVTANSDDYDVVVGHTRFNIALAAEGILKNLSDIEYLDFTKDYWSELYISNISYKNNVYWATGDLTTNFIGYMYAMFVNAPMWTNYFGSENLYQIVKDGKWTVDKLNEYSSVAYVDLNGNSIKDDQDSYGVIMQKGHVLNGMAFSTGVQYTSRDDNGNPYVSVANEHTVNVFDALHSLFYNTDYGRMLDNSAFDGLSVTMFTSDRLLFCPNTFQFCANAKVRDMESDFYVIPLPKYDDTQKAYRVNQYDGVPIYGIPITADPSRDDAIGATLEAMCSMSSTMVIPVYYDIALKNKYSRDQGAAEMIDLVHDSVTADFGFAWGDTVGGLMNLFYDNIQSDSIANILQRQQKSWDKSMEKLLQKLDASGE